MDHVQKHWGKYVAVIVVLVVAYFGFRQGGWFRSASTATSTATHS